VRALPFVHKYDNGFSPGDGHRTISEFGNFVNSGRGRATLIALRALAPSIAAAQFGGLNMPRTDYFAPRRTT
jgi:hypothetical protein